MKMARVMAKIIFRILFLIILQSGGLFVTGNPLIVEDQRQEGKTNVQIDLKDVQVLALVDSDILEDYMHYDYAYDYEDFTIKPISKPTTTKSPTFSTSESNHPIDAWPTKAPLNSSSTSVTEIVPSSTSVTVSTVKVPANDSEPTSPSSIELTNKTAVSVEASNREFTPLSSSISNSVVSSKVSNESETLKRHSSDVESRKRCPSGFILRSGRCFKRRISLLSPNFALKRLGPALARAAQSYIKQE